MKDSYKLFVVGMFIATLLSFWIFYPKYQFFVKENNTFRANKITGALEVYMPEYSFWFELKNRTTEAEALAAYQDKQQQQSIKEAIVEKEQKENAEKHRLKVNQWCKDHPGEICPFAATPAE